MFFQTDWHREVGGGEKDLKKEIHPEDEGRQNEMTGIKQTSVFLGDISHLTPSYWSVSELRNRLGRSKRDRESQTAQRQRAQTAKGKEKRKRRQLTGGRDRWETRAAATMMETRCRPLQYTTDWGKGRKSNRAQRSPK